MDISNCADVTPRFSKNGWFNIHNSQLKQAYSIKPSVLIYGDSIAAGLSRYPSVWEKLLSLNCFNMGIRGDRVEHVAWRMNKYRLLDSVDFVILHCSTNNVDHDSSANIANAIVEMGYRLLKQKPSLKFIISSLLPRDTSLSSPRRHKIITIDNHLEKLCSLNNNIFLSWQPLLHK